MNADEQFTRLLPLERVFGAGAAKRIVWRAIANGRLETAWAFALGRWGGLRFAEILRTRGDDLDWSQRAISIDDVKSRRRRLCPLFPELAAVLPRDLSGPLFSVLAGESWPTVASRIEAVAAEVDVELEKPLFHYLRAARYMELRCRFPEKDVSDWLGFPHRAASPHDAAFRIATKEHG